MTDLAAIEGITQQTIERLNQKHISSVELLSIQDLRMLHSIVGGAMNELTDLMHKMKQFAKLTGTIFVYTNKVFGKISNYGGNPNAPRGGHVLSHACDYRIRTTHGRCDEIRFKCLKSPSQPVFETRVSLGWGGFYGNSRLMKNSFTTLKQFVCAERDSYLKITRQTEEVTV